jgi:hypothetical protein
LKSRKETYKEDREVTGDKVGERKWGWYGRDFLEISEERASKRKV